MSWSLLWVDHWSGCKTTLSPEPPSAHASSSDRAARQNRVATGNAIPFEQTEDLCQARLMAAHAALERLADAPAQAPAADRG